MGGFLDQFFEVLQERVILNFGIYFFIGAFATKRFARSRIFSYGLPQDILSKKTKSKRGRDVHHPPTRPLCFGGLRTGGGGVPGTTTFDCPENWQAEYSIYTYATIKCCWKILYLRLLGKVFFKITLVLGLKKSS